MALAKQIVELLSQKPNMDSNEIASALTAKITTVKVTLHNMVKAEKLSRHRVEKSEKSKPGPKKLYLYTVYEVKSDNANTQNG